MTDTWTLRTRSVFSRQTIFQAGLPRCASIRRTRLWGLPAVLVSNRFFFSRLLAFVCGVLFFSSSAASQSADEVHTIPRIGPEEARPVGPKLTDSESTLHRAKPLRANVDVVLVPVSVTDLMNRPVLGLQEQDFKVYEDNALQKVQYFSAEEAPISVGLLLDTSKSMANKFVTERAAAEEFFKNANPQDDYFVITFADQPRLLTTSIQSIEDMQQTLTASSPDGHTALLDAIYLALARMRSARYQRRALLIISDGADNHSRYGLKEVRRLVEEANVDVYAIGIFDSVFFRSFEELMGKRWLGEITDVTGGQTVAAASLDKVPELAAAVSRQMRNQYLLGYRPQNISRDGKWRKIKVHVVPSAGTSRVQTHYKKGYVATAR
jgi:Ca-activated chloride channel family protein